ncbi:hypothetical protein KCU77_g9832, partial [Aureobasidium melanogenum]
MKRHPLDISMELDSDFDMSFAHNSRNGFALTRRVTGTVYELARPMWPANDAVTPAISERKIRELECGNDDEKLMATFARHVINSTRNRRPGTRWVSHRSLRKAFAEHFDQSGFLAESSWKHKTAGDFGLPDLFFRTVDDGKACLGPNESVNDLIEDLGQAPALQALTAEEYQQLRNRVVHDKHSASITTDQPQSFDTSIQSGESLQDEGGPRTTKDGSDVPCPSKRLRLMSSAKSQLVDKTEAHSVLGPGWFRVTPDRMSPPGTKPRVSPETKHCTPSHGLGLSTPNTKNLEKNNTHVASQQRNDQRTSAKPRTMHEHRRKPLQQDQADITDSEGQSKPVQLVSPLVASDMEAVKTVLIPKICDILKDFPTSPEDESFLPLLRQLVRATVANTPQAIEERHLDLLTHVVTHCTSSSPTDQVKTASLVRPILKILSRNRHNLAGQTHSQIQRDINPATRASDLDWLRALHAELLLFEAQHEGDHEGQ